MQKLSASLSQNKIYFIGLLVILFSCSVFFLFNGNEAVFLSIDSYHPFYLDVFFINYTFIGDGIFACCFIAIMFFYFKRKQFGFALLYSFLISGSAVQLIKNLLGSSSPKLYFESGTYLNILDGIALSEISGLPSGHTAAAFAIVTVMVLMVKNKNLQLLFLMLAILAGYSRIYLAQHFLQDVIIGGLLGTCSGILAFHYAQNPVNIKRLFNKVNQAPADAVSSSNAMQTV